MPRTSRIAQLAWITVFAVPVTIAAFELPASGAMSTPDPSTLGMRPSGGFLQPERLAQYEAELGGGISWYVAMAGRESPNDMRGSVRGQLLGADAVLPGVADRMNLVMTVPLAFGKGSAKDEKGRADIRTALTETAVGTWDEDYRLVAQSLIEGGYPDAVIRLGHEFTGGWYPWSAQGNADVYIAAFQHVHDVMLSMSPDFRFEWNGARNSFAEFGPPAYPGDEYVDVIGLDVYYEPWKGDPESYDEEVWARRYENVLAFHRDFAISHNKPVSYAEWANGEVDEPRFIEHMIDWFADLPDEGGGRLLYHSYFTPNNPTYDLDNYPESKSIYLDRFEGGGEIPPSPAEAIAKSAPTEPAPTTPPTTVPVTTVPATTVPATTVPATTAPPTTVPATTPPATTAPPAPSAAAATQLMLFDHLATQTPDAYWEPVANQPADYTAPVNLAGGNAYLKLDMVSKPSDKLMHPQVCFWTHAESRKFKFETCSETKAISVTAEGTYWANLGPVASWWKMNGVYDWAQPSSVVRIMFKDPATGQLFMGTKCGAACYPGDDLLDHIPLRYSGELVLVAKGAQLVPPAGWEACPKTLATSCGGGTPPTTTPPTTTPPTTTPTHPTTTPPTTTPPPDSTVRIDVDPTAHAVVGETFTIDASIEAEQIDWKKISGPSMRWLDRTSERPVDDVRCRRHVPPHGHRPIR